MALRCTVFGHDWGETDVEREREEEGSEVVVTVREVRTCDRCGSEDVLGESMEVTALDQPAPEAASEEPDRAPEPTESPERSFEGDRDDGVILDDDAEGSETDDRDPRAWPERPEHERADDEPGEPEPWPETARADEDDGRTEERFVGAGDPSADPAEGAPAHGQPAGGAAEADPPADREDPPSDGVDLESDRAETTPDGADPESDRDGGGEIIDASEAEPDTGGEDTDGTEADGPDAADAGPSDVEGGGPDAGTPPEEGATERDDEEPAQGGTVDIPTAESEPSGDGEAAREPGHGGRETEAAAEDVPEDAAAGDRDAGTDATVAETDDGPEEPAAMGPEATQRPDDDAEILDETDTTEQSRVTASEPVDPDEVDGTRESSPGGTAGSGPASDRTGPSTGGAGPTGAGGGGEDDRGPSPEHIEFYCPECGFVDDSTWPSRRAGDICPECQRSYLAEREV